MTPGLEEEPSARIGRYKLLELIGEGGFGSVWSAEQEEPVRRTVALKIIKLGMDTRQVVARFEAERQALAMMDHPGIAKVLDGGATPTGRPYFVMELVHGVRITTYCDEARLELAARLDLFMQVCHAVQHAHQKGIIHRDLKPSNILVSLQDGHPTPKVIDFGIAKATRASLTEMTLHTEIGQVVGTPDYMAPEQAGVTALDVDTRADIYALGVVLYEFVTGTKPFDMSTLMRRGYEEILRHIKDVDPPRPSTRIDIETEHVLTLAKAERVAAASIVRRVRRDLDWIVMKALEKERSRRYQTADEFAADIARFLHDEPVLARPPSTTYRLRKYVKRHRLGVAAALAVCLALIIGFASAFASYVEAGAQRDAARVAEQEALREKIAADRARSEEHEARQRSEESEAKAATEARHARAERDKSERIADFMAVTLDAVSPETARDRDTTLLSEMMDAAALRITRGELTDLPEAEISLRQTIGKVYTDIAAYDAAREMLVPALKLAKTAFPGDHPLVATSLRQLGSLDMQRGELTTAETLLEEALAMTERLAHGDDPGVMAAMYDAGFLHQKLGNYDRAERLFRDALAMCRRIYPEDTARIASHTNSLALLLNERARVHEAETLFHEALALMRQTYPAAHPSTAAMLNNLGMLYWRRRDFGPAEAHYREALDMLRQVHRGDHPHVAALLNNLAVLLQERGDLVGAEPLYREGLEMSRRLTPGDHPAVANGMLNFGAFLQSRGETGPAEEQYLEALDMMRRLYKGDHLDVATCLNNLATLSAEPERAVELYREAIAMLRRLYPDGHLTVANALVSLAVELEALGDLDSAEPLCREAVEMASRVLTPDSAPVASMRRVWLTILEAQKNSPAAAPK